MMSTITAEPTPYAGTPQFLDGPSVRRDLVALRGLVRRVLTKRHASVTITTDGQGMLDEQAATESYQFEKCEGEHPQARDARLIEFLIDVYARYREHPGNAIRFSAHDGRLTAFVERQNGTDRLLRVEQSLDALAQQIASLQTFLHATAARPEAAATYELSGKEFSGG